MSTRKETMNHKKAAPENLLIPALAHELRTPLNAIGGWVEILGTDADNLSALQRKALDGIERAVNQQAHILDGLQGRGQATAGTATHHPAADLVDYIVRCASTGKTTIALRAEEEHAPVACRDNGSLAHTIALLIEALSRVSADLDWQLVTVPRVTLARSTGQTGEPGTGIQLIATGPGDETPDLAADATLLAAATPDCLGALRDFPRQLLAAWRIGAGLNDAGLALSVSGNRLTIASTGALI